MATRQRATGGPDCSQAAATTKTEVEIKGHKKKAVIADCCCETAHQALAVGLAVKQAGNTSDKEHLTTLVQEVRNENALDEHCFIAFGLDDETFNALTKTLATFRGK